MSTSVILILLALTVIALIIVYKFRTCRDNFVSTFLKKDNTEEQKSKVYPPVKNEEYYETGEIKKIYYTVNKQKHGEEIVYYPTGERNKITNWQNGLLDGSYTVFFRDQQVYIQRNYSKGILVNQIIKDKKGNVITV